MSTMLDPSNVTLYYEKSTVLKQRALKDLTISKLMVVLTKSSLSLIYTNESPSQSAGMTNKFYCVRMLFC